MLPLTTSCEASDKPCHFTRPHFLICKMGIRTQGFCEMG